MFPTLSDSSSRSSSSSPTSFAASTASKASSDANCAVCGDGVRGKHYGAPACSGCTVFFRRAVNNQNHFKCDKKGNCSITFTTRRVCRCCRLRKCYSVGMKAEAVKRRDLIGPRKPKSLISPGSSRCFSSSDSDIEASRSVCIDALIRIQRYQRSQHQGYSAIPSDSDECVRVKKFGKFHRRARAHDMNFNLKLGLENANEWGMQFDAYRGLRQSDKNIVLSEFTLAFSLIDQGLKTAYEAEDEFWLLQNGSFLHPDYFLSLSSENTGKMDLEKKAELHYAFVNELVKCISTPFRDLQIDEFECAVLKTVLLLTPSFPGKVVYPTVDSLHAKCMSKLMEHCCRKSSDTGPERFGEILLLIGSIRCAIKTIYNQTRVSDIFHLKDFDPFVRNIFLS